MTAAHPALLSEEHAVIARRAMSCALALLGPLCDGCRLAGRDRRTTRSACSGESYVLVSALRELFGLDAEIELEGETGASVTELRRKGKSA